ncbi:hypothetical protein PENTCL1PPCAC_23760 [Pristionchus entomophagus]|uniref:Peptidyl-prolyl cis-trans isomerase n=1 Tax=Pristionchus entomophagus TaxID=358040 RepID=A0AAV5U3X2_9BILA|nr:hypothetical protein PENTCL1PPCAC_23760 [Pristionchus entomophagus]
MSVLLETSLGDIVIDLFTKERPNCSLNFLKLCKMKYYNLCQFHYIEKDYVAQTGDPTGTGRGGESVFGMMYGEQARFFEKEVVPKLRHNRRGLVSFVDGGNGMLGSQFFITLSEDGIDYLDEKHTIFGQVTEGDETLEALNSQICDEKDHSPYRDIRINHTTVIHDPFEDAKALSYPRRSPSPTMEQLLVVNKIALDENEEENEGKSAAEIEEEMREKEAIAQAQILEMVGDLRHADEKPMDNVLFVCKLNEVTTDEDLEIIFSRFGKIVCCEVIKDRRTKKSLQYAFIEFETNEACEQAFFKMDNVLIDDRRIHVDFSQSVAKNYKWEKGGAKKEDKGGFGRNDGRPIRQERREIKREEGREVKREYERDIKREYGREVKREVKREERERSRSPRRRRDEGRDRSRERRDEKRKRSRSRDHGKSDEKRRREKSRERSRR